LSFYKYAAPTALDILCVFASLRWIFRISPSLKLHRQIDLDLFSDSINGSHAMTGVPEIQTNRERCEFSIQFGKEILWACPELHASTWRRW
jgi:hypothetical protein